MSDYTPTTDEVRASWFSKESGLAVSAMSTISSGEYTGFDRWLEQVKAEAWEEGKRAEETAWMHVFDGHPVAEGEFCDECSTENPYRKGETE